MPDSYLGFLGLLALAIGLISYIPYFRGILADQTKPHAFSWFIWGLLTAIAFFAQVTSGAGPGAWVTGFTAIVCFIIVGFALVKGEKKITLSDWVTFIAALATLPIWYATDNPLYAVILITLIDALGFYPTFRKSWHKPQEEVTVTYGLSAVKFAIALGALQNLNWTTALYPASLVLMNGAFVIMVLWRRNVAK